MSAAEVSDATDPEGLSMSDEDEVLPSNQKELPSKLLEEMSAEEKLQSAAQLGQGQLVRELLTQGVPVSIDQNGSTAMHQAAQGGFAEVVRILLDYGVDIDLPDSGGYTALHKAAAKGHLCVLGLLINEGCDIDIQDDTYGNTALHEAAWNGWSKSVDLLLKNKSNAFIANRAGCTPLHLAAQSGHNQSGRALLYAGCSPDVKNNYGDTPLHTAARYGHAGIARILISARCSISEQNKNGDTSLHIAAAFKRRKIAKLLVEGGINPQLANKQKETATEIARRKEHMSIIEIIHHGHAEPTNGVTLNYSLDNTTHSSQYSQHVKSRETTPETREKKKSSGLVSWIKRKFAKEKMERERAGRSGIYNSKSLTAADGSQGLFSQYVRRQGFVSYRDLAGNVRQGPVGYVPNCQCEASKLAPGLDHHVTHRNYSQLMSNERLPNHELYANHKGFCEEMTPEERIKAEKQECLERLKKLSAQERNMSTKQLEEAETNLREDLHSWLATQISDTREGDPFGYSIASKQQRFGDDFDHERIARYETMNSENYLPPPRLFRSRSDETLTHSEYSFHGRAFKSREAAMEELKMLKHHEEIRERRKRIRAGIHVEGLSSDKFTENNNYIIAEAAKKQIPGLWVSRDHLDEETSRTDTGCDSPSTPQTNTSNNEVPQANHRSESFATRTGNGKPIIDRVLGRRESNKRPDQKTDHKSSMPLKSALRQPRLSGNFDVKKYAVSRSNSLPRDSKVAFNIGNEAIELRKPVKSVHYDDSVKSKEIAQDQPPTSSLSSTQMEQALHPGKRETPIGGHDDKYSENVKPPLPSYQSISVIRKPPFLSPPATVSGKQLAYGNDNTSDLRETIVNTRNELLARNKSDTFKPTEGYNSHRSDVLPVFEDPSKSLNAAPYPNGLNRLFNKPKLSSSSDPSSNFYKSQDAVQQPSQRQTALPFSHYANGSAQHSQKESQLSSAAPTNQSYATSSLPRPPQRTASTSVAESQRRAPLPSYEEIQSNRAGQPTRQPPPLYNKTPPGYSNTTHSFHDAFAQRVTAKQSEKTTSGLHRSLSVHEPSSDHTTVVDSTSICSSSNMDSGYGGNFYDSNTNGSPSEKSWYQQSLQSAALKMNATQMLNNHRHRNGNHNNQNGFFDQNDSAVNPKMSSKVQYTARPNHELAASDTSRVVQSRVQPAYAKHPVNGATSNERPISSGHQANYGLVYPAPKRTIYSNMISDV